MALIKCSNCGRMISDKAKACPHCGHQIGLENKHGESSQPRFNQNQEAQVQTERAIISEPVEYYKEPKHKSNVGLIALIVIGLLALLGVVGWLWYDNNQKRAEQERQLAILAEKARQDSIAAAELREQLRRDSIAEAQKQEQISLIYNEYARVLKKHHDGRYFLFDITKDGIPELWVHAHNSNERSQGYCAPMHIFTIKDNKSKELELYETSYLDLVQFDSYYQGNDYIIEFYNDVGDGYCETMLVHLIYNGEKIIRKIIRECDCEENVHISEPKISELDLMDYDSLKQKLDLIMRI